MERIDPEYEAERAGDVGAVPRLPPGHVDDEGRGWTARVAGAVGASELTLAGLVKHLALVEDDWFTRLLLGLEARAVGLGAGTTTATGSSTLRRTNRRVRARAVHRGL